MRAVTWEKLARSSDLILAPQYPFNFREISFLSLCHAGRDQVERAVRGKGRTFLPTDDVAGMIAGQVDPTLGLGPYLITRGRAGVGAADPGTEVVRNVSPADVDGVLQLLRAAGMQ